MIKERRLLEGIALKMKMAKFGGTEWSKAKIKGLYAEVAKYRE